MDVATELDAVGFSPEERESIGLPKESELDVLIKTSYQLLDLITFFTTGPDETRAWTIKKGTKAPQAGGVIHSDFEKNFVKAEVINWQKLLEAGGWAEAREKGWLRLEGKDYVVQDGDVIVIKHG
jgi:ribosome-binding ATPase YchF (GTP1/OBG family)